MNKQDFYFDLPKELIAQTPLLDRSASRLLVYDLKDGHIEHLNFKDIIQYFKKGDCLVINDTKVIPARLIGVTKKTGSNAEILLLKRIDEYRFEALVKPGKKMKVGAEVSFGDGLLECYVEEIVDGGNRIIRFAYNGIWEEILDKLGEMPLPPYITQKLEDKTRYQTVYAKHEGSAAAPTAGLHFTQGLLNELEANDIRIAHITLHVGLGTFRPVKEDDILKHNMHSEFYHIEKSQADIINQTKKEGGRIIAVGTTSCRTLESCTLEEGFVKEGSGYTDIFIFPGYHFKIVDGLITNFHLPESTLIMLVSALCGRENAISAYEEAIKNKYRFFSFGDAMLLINTQL